MRRSSWKRSERAIAAALGGERLPVTGRKGPDIAHGLLAPEVKSRGKLPKYLHDWLAQARNGAPAGRLPIVVMHEAGRPHASDLVLLALGDLAELLRGTHVDDQQ